MNLDLKRARKWPTDKLKKLFFCLTLFTLVQERASALELFDLKHFEKKITNEAVLAANQVQSICQGKRNPHSINSSGNSLQLSKQDPLACSYPEFLKELLTNHRELQTKLNAKDLPMASLLSGFAYEGFFWGLLEASDEGSLTSIAFYLQQLVFIKSSLSSLRRAIRDWPIEKSQKQDLLKTLELFSLYLESPTRLDFILKLQETRPEILPVLFPQLKNVNLKKVLHSLIFDVMQMPFLKQYTFENEEIFNGDLAYQYSSWAEKHFQDIVLSNQRAPYTFSYLSHLDSRGLNNPDASSSFLMKLDPDTLEKYELQRIQDLYNFFSQPSLPLDMEINTNLLTANTSESLKAFATKSPLLLENPDGLRLQNEVLNHPCTTGTLLSDLASAYITKIEPQGIFSSSTNHSASKTPSSTTQLPYLTSLHQFGAFASLTSLRMLQGTKPGIHSRKGIRILELLRFRKSMAGFLNQSFAAYYPKRQIDFIEIEKLIGPQLVNLTKDEEALRKDLIETYKDNFKALTNGIKL